jgi:hypothetical protein
MPRSDYNDVEIKHGGQIGEFVWESNEKWGFGLRDSPSREGGGRPESASN